MSKIETLQEELYTLQNNFDSLKRLHETSNIELERLQKDNTRLSQENQILKMQGTQWDSEKGLQTTIIQQTLDNANHKNNQYLEEIESLKKEIRYLKEPKN